MSNYCNPCTKVKDLLMCTSVLEIGKITSVNTEVNILFTNNTTGNKTILPATSDGTGLISVTIGCDTQFIEGHDYSLTVLNKPFVNLDDIHTVNISNVNYTCFALRFVNVVNANCQTQKIEVL